MIIDDNEQLFQVPREDLRWRICFPNEFNPDSGSQKGVLVFEIKKIKTKGQS